MQSLTAQREDARIDRGFASLLERTASRIASGARRVGWKVGINSPSVQHRLGLRGPVLGVLTSDTLRDDGVLAAPKEGTLLVEAELALRLGPRHPAEGTGETPVIAAVAPALELLCIDRPLDDVAEVVAHNSFHAGFALGPWTSDAPVTNVDAISLDLRVDGEGASALDPALIVGAPIDVVRFAEGFLAARNEGLAEGDVLLCGALNAPLIVTPGQRISARIQPAGRIDCEVA